jgi:hypothetical protein
MLKPDVTARWMSGHANDTEREGAEVSERGKHDRLNLIGTSDRSLFIPSTRAGGVGKALLLSFLKTVD